MAKKMGDKEVIEKIIEMYKLIIHKKSFVEDIFNADIGSRALKLHKKNSNHIVIKSSKIGGKIAFDFFENIFWGK